MPQKKLVIVKTISFYAIKMPPTKMPIATGTTIPPRGRDASSCRSGLPAVAWAGGGAIATQDVEVMVVTTPSFRVVVTVCGTGREVALVIVDSVIVLDKGGPVVSVEQLLASDTRRVGVLGPVSSREP